MGPVDVLKGCFSPVDDREGGGLGGPVPCFGTVVVEREKEAMEDRFWSLGAGTASSSSFFVGKFGEDLLFRTGSLDARGIPDGGLLDVDALRSSIVFQ